MAKYTITIDRLKKNDFDFGLTDYPIFDEAYRETLNKDIIDYYLMYEIGFETPALFKHYLNTKMNIIMPRYNAIYKAQLEIMKNPLGNVDITETMNREVNGEGKSETESQNNGKNLFQDTPQGQLSSTDIDDQKWATNLTLDKGETTANSETTVKNVEEYTKTLVGYNGRKYGVEVYNKLVSSFKSINQEIISELEDLFMGIL